MTAPVVCTQEQKPTMQFILPDSFKEISQVPKPTDERVTIKHEPEKNVAVIRYSGYNSDEQEKVKARTMLMSWRAYDILLMT